MKQMMQHLRSDFATGILLGFLFASVVFMFWNAS